MIFLKKLLCKHEWNIAEYDAFTASWLKDKKYIPELYTNKKYKYCTKQCGKFKKITM